MTSASTYSGKPGTQSGHRDAQPGGVVEEGAGRPGGAGQTGVAQSSLGGGGGGQFTAVQQGAVGGASAAGIFVPCGVRRCRGRSSTVRGFRASPGPLRPEPPTPPGRWPPRAARRRAARPGACRGIVRPCRRRGPGRRRHCGGSPVPGAREVTALARSGDPAAARVLTTAGQALGTVLGQLVRVLDPSVIVLGGGLAPATDRCTPPCARPTPTPPAAAPRRRPSTGPPSARTPA
ncbi:ROK family protein [Streptomyces sp. NPDC020792]|uniref:ROK family protein n=1 Tax=Streptomyces sp. NPDC020792 TaxID=3365089 RepID=UPI00378D0F40